MFQTAPISAHCPRTLRWDLNRASAQNGCIPKLSPGRPPRPPDHGHPRSQEPCPAPAARMPRRHGSPNTSAHTAGLNIPTTPASRALLPAKSPLPTLKLLQTPVAPHAPRLLVASHPRRPRRPLRLGLAEGRPVCQPPESPQLPGASPLPAPPPAPGRPQRFPARPGTPAGPARLTDAAPPPRPLNRPCPAPSRDAP